MALTATDGSVLTRYIWDAWGNLVQQTGSSAQPFGYIGFQRDQESGLYNARNRYYDAGVGRFLREDPYPGDPKQPIGLHPYLYASANPTLATDPSGLYAESVHFYLTYIVSRTLGYTQQEAARLSFFSALPDEIGHFDAKSTMFNKVLSSPNSKRKPHNDTYQQEMHALTGTQAEGETKVTLEAVQELIDSGDLAGAGFAIHRLGDTFAHRILTKENGKYGEDTRLYDTGLGHLGDWTSPDEPSRRPSTMANFIEKLTDVIKKAPVSEEQMTKINLINQALAESIQEAYGWTTVRAGSHGHRRIRRVDHALAEKLFTKKLRKLAIDLENGDASGVLNPEEAELSLPDNKDDVEKNLRGMRKSAERDKIDFDKATGGKVTETEITAKGDWFVKYMNEKRRNAGIIKGDPNTKQESRNSAQSESVVRTEQQDTLDQGQVEPRD